jgi:repressor LexA
VINSDNQARHGPADPSGKRLTRRQLAVYRFVEERVRDARVPPSVREVAKHFGFSSVRSAEKHLVALQLKGLIRRRRGARNLQLVAREERAPYGGSIPVLGRVPAGTPVLAVENFDGFLEFRDLFGDSDQLFALRVTGDSMVNAGISPGDWVIVRMQQTVSHGEIAVVYTGEDAEATVKRVLFEKERIRLQPENDRLSPSFVPRGDPSFQVAGKVMGLVRRL